MTHQLSFKLNLIAIWLVVSMAGAVGSTSMAKPGCKEVCGNVSIPFPFGISGNCYHEPWYEIICNKTFSPPKPFLRRLNLEVMEITFTPLEALPLMTVGTPPLNICTGGVVGNSSSTQRNTSVDLAGSPYRFSSDYNIFMVEGCTGGVVMMNRSNEILAGCASICPKNYSTAQNYCYGVNCCQTPIPIQYSLDFYKIHFDDEATPNTNTCMAAALMADTSIMTYPQWISREDRKQEYVERISSGGSFPTKLEWVVKDWSIKHSPSESFYCNTLLRLSSIYEDIYWNLTSEDMEDLVSCACRDLYEGNPYLHNGCKIAKGCEQCSWMDCYQDGENLTSYHCRKSWWVTRAPILGASGAAGSILFLLGCYWLYQFVKKKKEMRQRAKYFKRNGGLLLQQQMSSSEGGVMEKTRIFTTNELEKATDNFNENRVLGHGGQGTVYKGMLMDGRIVAIKKSKQVDEDQLEQFINEVVIVSQINHRNVVKLLGCCLETEVPLLVYEFIPNGTLFQHIHSSSEDFHLTWKMRLQIAVESAGALAYLHSSSSAPIYHRDIKSSNILLDDKYRAKVSDFGTSRAINIDQTHLTTCVIGTFGYLDPEYFQSNQFTEKSDVYSFGVVLVELLTSKRPISATKPGEWRNLAHEFLFMMEGSRLLNILDGQLLQEGKKEDLWAVANLAKQCLNLNGKLRPTMKELAMALENIRSAHVPHLAQLTFPNNSDDAVARMSEEMNGGSLGFRAMSLVDDHSCSSYEQTAWFNTL